MKIAAPTILLAVLLMASPAPAAGTSGNPAGPAAVAHPHHGSANPEPAPAQAQAGKRWASDAPLREGMGRIRDAVGALGHFSMGHLSAAQAIGLAEDIEQDVKFLVANCKLEPEADAVLHGIIGKLLQGAQAIKADPSDAAALAKLREALADYERSFDQGAA